MNYKKFNYFIYFKLIKRGLGLGIGDWGLWIGDWAQCPKSKAAFPKQSSPMLKPLIFNLKWIK